MANIVTIDGIPVYQALVDDENTGMLRISLVDDPAVQSDFLAFSAQKRVPQLYAVQNEAKRLVLGCVMRADFPIYRRDEGLKGEYYIIYKADTIRKMAEKYLAEGRQNNVNLMHQPGSDVEGVEMVQFFIKGDGLNPEGFDDIADGSLFAEFHVSNDDVWEAVKAGTYKGFSLEGLFDLTPEQSKPYIEQVVDILDGAFSKILNQTEYEKMKKNGLLARLAKALVEGRNVTTDKGVLAWDSDEELAVGDSVYIEDEEGNRNPVEDGEYRTEDKVIVVEKSVVTEVRDLETEPEAEPEAETAAEQEAEAVKASEVNTDKGRLIWDGEEDLREGFDVYTEDEEGNRVPAADGEYKTEDGKTIVVVDGKVAELRDPEAEVAPEEGNDELAEAKGRIADLEAKIAELEEAVAKMSKAPAARPAHEEVGTSFSKTGLKGLDRLAELMGK